MALSSTPGIYYNNGEAFYLPGGLAGLPSTALTSGWSGPSLSGVSNVTGATSVGPTAPGPQLPGGTAGFPTAAQRTTGASSWLDGLSHLTGGLTWSHLVLWLAILLGGYIVIEHFAGGKRRRR